jgi:hypothetical protein
VEVQGIPQSEAAAVARISLDEGNSWVTGAGGEARTAKAASEARLLVLAPPYAVEVGYDVGTPHDQL